MELEFVLKAMRRYWSVVAAFTLMALGSTVLLSPSPAVRYESSALVLVVSGEGGSAGDRFVASELVILRSPAIAERAVQLADVPMSAAEIAGAVAFSQIPGTDVVRLTASSASPTEAQAIANGYADAYLESKSSVGTAGQEVDAALLERSANEIAAQLADVDRRIEAALEPYVEAAQAQADGQEISIPEVQDVAPALAVEREVLTDRYRSVLLQQLEGEFTQPAQEATDRQVIQRAEAPKQPLETSSSVPALAVVLGGFLLGVAAATGLARYSRYVLDATEVEHILGAPIAADIPRRRALRSGSLDQLGQLPDDVNLAINDLCVLAESASATTPGWSVVVTGTQSNIGSTTVAAAMAMRYAELGSRVLLIDLDTEDPALSAHFGAAAGGFSALPDLDDDDLGGSRLTPTGFPMLWVVGGWETSRRLRPSRPELQAALKAASRCADVVVVDAGPILASSSATALAQSANAVVLTVPVGRQPRASLTQTSRQLRLGEGHLFPVGVPNPRRTHRTKPTTSSPTFSDLAGPFDESDGSDLPVPDVSGRRS